MYYIQIKFNSNYTHDHSKNAVKIFTQQSHLSSEFNESQYTMYLLCYGNGTLNCET